MQTDANLPAGGLEQGQLWKVDHGYIFIVELGKRLIHYKLLRRPDQAAALTRLIGIEAMANFLRHTDAELVSQPLAMA